jgi:sulfite exporter TauE/SafE
MTTLWPWLASAFVVGLMGGVHCAGMCGGIATALAQRDPLQRDPLQSGSMNSGGNVQALRWMPGALALHGVRQTVLSAGRITTYALLGAFMGALALAVNHGLMSSVFSPEQATLALTYVRHTLLIVAYVLMMLLGLQLAGVLTWLAPLERLGLHWWKPVQPWLQSLMRSNARGTRAWVREYLLGMLWGLVPCAMVASMLSLALLSADPLQGAAVMLAFGLGTLPNLLAFGFVAGAGRVWLRRPAVRVVAGCVVLISGVVGLLQANALIAHQGGWYCAPATSSAQ